MKVVKTSEKVVKIIDRQPSPSALSWDMVQAMKEAIEEIKSGDLPNKGVVIFLDDDNLRFDIRWKKAGVLNSEAIALIEIFKSELLDMLKK